MEEKLRILPPLQNTDGVSILIMSDYISKCFKDFEIIASALGSSRKHKPTLPQLCRGCLYIKKPTGVPTCPPQFKEGGVASRYFCAKCKCNTKLCQPPAKNSITLVKEGKTIQVNCLWDSGSESSFFSPALLHFTNPQARDKPLSRLKPYLQVPPGRKLFMELRRHSRWPFQMGKQYI